MVRPYSGPEDSTAFIPRVRYAQPWLFKLIPFGNRFDLGIWNSIALPKGSIGSISPNPRVHTLLTVVNNVVRIAFLTGEERD